MSRKIIVAYTNKEKFEKVKTELGWNKNPNLVAINLNNKRSLNNLAGIQKKEIKTFWLMPNYENGKYYQDLKKRINLIYKSL